MSNSNIKAVIFDMGGLLIDSEDLWTEAEIKILTRIGVPLTPKMALESMGLRGDEVVEYWFARYPWTGVTKEKVHADIVKEVAYLIKDKAELMEGADKIIDLFVSQDIPMAIASSESVVIDVVLDKFDMRKKMKVVCSAEHELFGKPDPGIYITTAKKLGVDPSQCLAFEDSPNGVLSAKAAGMKCVAVPNPEVRDNEIYNQADLILNSLKDFTLEHLENLNK